MEYHIYFQNEFKEEKFIETIIIEEELNQESVLKCLERISAYLEKHSRKSYYQRFWFEKDINRIVVDFGSHSEFFNIYYNKIQ